MQNCIYQPHVRPCLAMGSQVQKERGTGHLRGKDGSTIQPKCSNLKFCCEDRLAGFFKNPFCSLRDEEEGLLLPVWHPRFPTACPWRCQVPAWRSDQPERIGNFFISSFFFHHLKYKRVFEWKFHFQRARVLSF